MIQGMQVGYNALRMPDGRLLQGPVVVETDQQGGPLSWHYLLHEEPCTRWVGGTLQVSEELIQKEI